MTYVSTSMRREVIKRAGNCCEYCLVNQEDRSLPYELDHIIAEKHGGETTLDNLCWSCYICNGYKGSDIASIDWDDSGQVAPLFNPRRQIWNEHFQFNVVTARIEPLTPEGRVTVFLLRLNSDEHVISRRLLVQLRRFPCQPQVVETV
jgi:hypothetical protein